MIALGMIGEFVYAIFDLPWIYRFSPAPLEKVRNALHIVSRLNTSRQQA